MRGFWSIPWRVIMKEKVMIGGNNNEHKTRENAESAAGRGA